MTRPLRALTAAQHDALDRIANRDPNARVIGWRNDRGPVLLGHRISLAVLDQTGRLRPTVRWPNPDGGTR